MISEADFLTHVIALAHIYHWKTHHVRPAWSNKGWRTPVAGDVGFVDLVLVRQPRVIFSELKTDRGGLTAAQREWLAALQECPGVETYLWRPRMWNDIVGVLR